jgi:cell division GTPase FtsZ
MGNAGTALMGIGRGTGRTRAQEAAAAAISSPLLDFPIEKARGVVFNIVGGHDLTLQEINAAAEVIYEAVDPNANIIFGALVDDSMEGEMAITVIATGFPIAKADEEGKLAQMQKKVQSTSSGLIRTIEETVRTAQAKQQQQQQTQTQTQRRDSVDKPGEGEESAARSAPRVIRQRIGESASPAEQVAEKSSRIASTEDDDLPDFLSRLRRNR